MDTVKLLVIGVVLVGCAGGDDDSASGAVDGGALTAGDDSKSADPRAALVWSCHCYHATMTLSGVPGRPLESDMRVCAQSKAQAGQLAANTIYTGCSACCHTDVACMLPVPYSDAGIQDWPELACGATEHDSQAP